MALITEMRASESRPAAVVEVVEEIMTIYRSLPPRPSIEEVEAAESILRTADLEEKSKMEEVLKMEELSVDIPRELSSVLREAKRTLVLFQLLEQRKEADFLVESERLFRAFDGLIRRANRVVSGEADGEEPFLSLQGHQGEEADGEIAEEKEEEEILTLVEKKVLLHDTQKDQAKGFSATGGEEVEKLSLIKVAAVIETSAKTESIFLDLKRKLMDKIEWLPLSIGKLTGVTVVDLSENRLMALPNSMGAMKALRRLTIYSNQIINLPESIGELANLEDLDCHANRLRSLPASFTNLTGLVSLDLSSNQYTQLPDFIGSLASLQRLNVETNDLEELPYTIGYCSALNELKADFNRLKALPEAIGKLGSLQTLSLHYNRIKGLPTTMSSLSSLRELDVSFNELESVPESLCLVMSLVRLNLGKNFADLRALPRSIGNLEMLEELDISDDQIKTLPDSFGLLSRLRVFRADETPLEVPPREVAKLGAQAVVEYMKDYADTQNGRSQPSKKKKTMAKETINKKMKGLCSWFFCCFVSA
ncbi:hypothetical protein SAY86_011242 [Trapa natans]|uniref:Disease resistance R13L4/SHOC-2-like LRR domain-containing protein n=1 Tax=Trapa natans TaxID=22666 RepID=A0AAN7LMX9_TRANT|nr:hypothetical protein SAY86_011242 [Trapa natans]